MTKVFIGGSRHISRLSAEIQHRLDNIIERGFPVLVGDANGADKAVQMYLHSKCYKAVEVFCSEGLCRNNVGAWQTRNVPAETRERNAQFYSAKDKVMAQEATIGLMVWDGKSVGTLLNVLRLLNLHKKVLMYIAPLKRFREFRQASEWDDFIATCDSSVRRKVEQRAIQETARPLSEPTPFQVSIPL